MTIFRVEIFCPEAEINRFFKEHLTWYTLYNLSRTITPFYARERSTFELNLHGCTKAKEKETENIFFSYD